MKKLKAYRYRLNPNSVQIAFFNQHFGSVRFVKNWAIALRSRYYRRYGKGVSSRRIQDQLVKKKRRAKWAWLNEVNSQSLLAALKDVDTAFQNFFKHGAKYPRFKKKYDSHQSFSTPQHVEVVNGKVKLPKLGLVSFVQHRLLPKGKIKTCTVSRGATGKHHISILLETDESEVAPTTIVEEESIGGDLGLTTFLTLSDGTKVENPRFLSRTLPRLKKQQRILSRKQKGSKSRSKQKLAVAKIHEKVANARKDFHHKTTHLLAVKNQATTYFGEDLLVRGMIKNPRLSRHIADVGWGMFDVMLQYKMKEAGKSYIKIDRFAPSSKSCIHCGFVHKGLSLSDRVFSCPFCGKKKDRDWAASVNIKRFGLKLVSEQAGIACGVKSSPSAKALRGAAEAKEVDISSLGSPEAPTRTALAV